MKAIVVVLATVAWMPTNVAAQDALYQCWGCMTRADSVAFESEVRVITDAVESCSNAAACPHRMSQLLQRIEANRNLPLIPQSLLVDVLSEALASRFNLSDPVYRVLLTDSDSTVQELAISALYWEEDWSNAGDLVSTVASVLSDSLSSEAIRYGLLFLLRENESIHLIESHVWRLARDKRFPLLARFAARELSYYFANERNMIDSVRALAAHDESAIGVEAAAFLLEEKREPESSVLFHGLVQKVASVARNADEPAEVRGRMLRVLSRYPDSDVVVPVLIDLLEPKNWFYGAHGDHSLVHSLVMLIAPLSDSQDSRMQKALRKLWDDIGTIPAEQDPDFVEWNLRTWVGERSNDAPDLNNHY
ncbi:MAG: hypothetical protein R2832_15295 [Rhodothermales bacterium]